MRNNAFQSQKMIIIDKKNSKQLSKVFRWKRKTLKRRLFKTNKIERHGVTSYLYNNDYLL